MHAKLQAIAEFWAARRPDGRLPSHRRFPPEDLKPWLGHVCLVAVERPSLRLLLRLVGSQVVQYDGRDYTGRYFDDIVAAEHRDAALAPYRESLRTGQPVGDIRPYIGPDATIARIHRLVLPCAEDGQTIDVFLAALYDER